MNQLLLSSFACCSQSSVLLRLTLCIPTTHICVKNTVLASMNCFLFNLSYNVMIMCEWHQLMYIAIITPSKSTTPPDFRCISPFVWQQSPKCQFFGQITTPKITLIYRQFLIQIICSKMKSLHLQQTSRSDLGIWLDVFLSTLPAGYTSAILSDPVLSISRCLVHTRKEFWVIQP